MAIDSGSGWPLMSRTGTLPNGLLFANSAASSSELYSASSCAIPLEFSAQRTRSHEFAP